MLSCLLTFMSLGCGGSQVPSLAPADSATEPVSYAIRGAWLAPREGAPLDSTVARATLARLHTMGVTHVVVGEEISMPKMAEPRLLWGQDDDELRRVLASIRAAGMHAILVPRIESPDFFVPPYPFRADIDFGDAAGWQPFHAAMERMLLHYAALAEQAEVAVFTLGIELKRSVRAAPERWRQIIAAVRQVYHGKLTYSANWYDEWQAVSFWDALDYVGVGAYFELHPEDGDAQRPAVEDLVLRWAPAAAALRSLSLAVERPVLFTEIGYTGFADCAERPWEWAGKAEREVSIDHARQADAYRALFRCFGAQDWMAGTCIWSFYTEPRYVRDWEYAVEGRPSAAVVRAAYRAPPSEPKRDR